MAKYKATGCARFFIVLIILAPLAYLGASWYLSEDGIGNIKSLLGIEKGNSDSESGDIYSDTSSDLQNQLAKQDEEIQQLKKENKQLKSRINELEAKVQELQGNGDGNH